MMMLLGSTWSPPAELLVAWADAGGVEVTVPPYEAVCYGRYQLSDGVTRTSWEEPLLGRSTFELELAPPPHAFPVKAKLLLSFQATCTTPDGRILERSRLPGLVVQLVGGRATEVVLQPPPAGEGTMVLEGPVGVWAVSSERPAYDPDDDPSLDHGEVAR